MPTKYIISKHTKKIQKGTVPFCIIFATFPVNMKQIEVGRKEKRPLCVTGGLE